MNRQAQAVVVMLVGSTVLKVSLTDAYLRYVKESLRPFLIASAIVLILVAVATLWYEIRKRPAVESHDGHGHGDHDPKSGWLMLLPVVSLLLVAPPALGADAAANAGTAAALKQSDYPALPAGDPAKISVMEYASRAIYDEGKSLGDRRVQLTGFVSKGKNGETYLTRMVLSCCAADGRPIKVAMSGSGAAATAALKPDTWLEVTGKYDKQTTPDGVNGEKIPYIAVDTATPVAAPAKQYEQ